MWLIQNIFGISALYIYHDSWNYLFVVYLTTLHYYCQTAENKEHIYVIHFCRFGTFFQIDGYCSKGSRVWTLLKKRPKNTSVLNNPPAPPSLVWRPVYRRNKVRAPCRRSKLQNGDSTLLIERVSPFVCEPRHKRDWTWFIGHGTTLRARESVMPPLVCADKYCNTAGNFVISH